MSNDKLILVVDDDPDLVESVSMKLEGEGFQVAKAYDGVEAWDRIKHERPHMLILDVMMPRKDGFELVVELKDDERTSHIPIILLTARADADSRIAGLSRGADAYLEKPFDSEELNVRISALIESRSKLQKRYA